MDAGGIIYNWPKGIILKKTNRILRNHNFSNFKKSDALWKRFFNYALTGEMNYAEARKEWGRKLGLKREIIEELIENDKMMFKEFTTPKRNIKSVLSKLKKDYRIIILSNSVNTSREMSRTLTRLGINYFDKIFTSHDIGYKKPHPKAYKAVLDYYKLKPNDIIFVGHSENEIYGANKLGIKTISLEKNKYANIFIKRISDIFSAIETLENKMC